MADKVAKPTNVHSAFRAADIIKKRKHDNAEALKSADNPNYVAKPYKPGKYR